jgi:hypothetical protein
MNVRARRGAHQGGQTLVIVALGMTAMLAMVALVIDGGNAFAQQRKTQNGIDATAEAGAVELARMLAGVSGTNAQWDQRVHDAVVAAAAANTVETLTTPDCATGPDPDPIACYVERNDQTGVVTVLTPVGSGAVPTPSGGSVLGVRAGGNRSFDTYFGGVVGLRDFTASARATAVAGYASGASANSVIPITFPVVFESCEGNGDILFPRGLGAQWPVGPDLALPMCKNGPGNVGFIDWTPKAGGASELAASIRSSNNPPITTPKWYFVSQTGAISSSQVQAALDELVGTDILIPIFGVRPDPVDPNLPQVGTCKDDPANDRRDWDDCGDIGSGSGSNNWYYLVTFAEFHLEAAYINGNGQAECNDPSLFNPGGGDNGKDCLVGYFKAPVIAGDVTVGSGGGSTNFLTPLGVQLIQ